MWKGYVTQNIIEIFTGNSNLISKIIKLILFIVLSVKFNNLTRINEHLMVKRLSACYRIQLIDSQYSKWLEYPASLNDVQNFAFHFCAWANYLPQETLRQSSFLFLDRVCKICILYMHRAKNLCFKALDTFWILYYWQ